MCESYDLAYGARAVRCQCGERIRYGEVRCMAHGSLLARFAGDGELLELAGTFYRPVEGFGVGHRIERLRGSIRHTVPTKVLRCTDCDGDLVLSQEALWAASDEAHAAGDPVPVAWLGGGGDERFVSPGADWWAFQAERLLRHHLDTRAGTAPADSEVEPDLGRALVSAVLGEGS